MGLFMLVGFWTRMPTQLKWKWTGGWIAGVDLSPKLYPNWKWVAIGSGLFLWSIVQLQALKAWHYGWMHDGRRGRLKACTTMSLQARWIWARVMEGWWSYNDMISGWQGRMMKIVWLLSAIDSDIGVFNSGEGVVQFHIAAVQSGRGMEDLDGA